MLLIQGLVAMVGAIVVLVKDPVAFIRAMIARLRKK
jgi:hypothetical protein